MKKNFLFLLIMLIFILFNCDLLLEMKLDSNKDNSNSIIQSHVNSPPVLNPIGNKTIVEGNTYNFEIKATDIDNNKLIYSAENIPSGATLNPDTGIFNWTNPQGGIYIVQFKVSDGKELVSQEITMSCWQIFVPNYDTYTSMYATAEYVPAENRASCSGSLDAGRVTFIMEGGIRYKAEFNISCHHGSFSSPGGGISSTSDKLETRQWTSGDCYIYGGNYGGVGLSNLIFYRIPN